MNDLLAALSVPCGDCGGGFEVAWCHAWGAYLCVSCRAQRNDEALRVPPVRIESKAVYPSRESMEAAVREAELQAAATGEQT
jgi:hypothetical protein